MARHPEIYASPEWEPARQFVISRANGLCELCWQKGTVKAGKDVDHIIELTDQNKHDWHIAYDPANLQYLCTDCHNHKHERSIGLQNFLFIPKKRPPRG
ncbi:HNH endonuclease [Paenibacillus whitsoniae]|uniref:Putative HNH nuclease YajD n=1 Tax=Paenibacillus whitsoniae TaxID=2496558 RepID=A0A430J7E4_9BACL|nr:HNH endonuclease [Paenibacillus whitsoniae]